MNTWSFYQKPVTDGTTQWLCLYTGVRKFGGDIVYYSLTSALHGLNAPIVRGTRGGRDARSVSLRDGERVPRNWVLSAQ